MSNEVWLALDMETFLNRYGNPPNSCDTVKFAGQKLGYKYYVACPKSVTKNHLKKE